MHHLTSQQIQYYAMGLHDEVDVPHIRSHVSNCKTCRERLTREAVLEIGIREFSQASTWCVACHRIEDSARCAHCGAALVVRDYAIEELIVQNSRGRIYVARDAEGKRVALKELAFVQAPSAEDTEAVEREASILRTLGHKGIPKFVASFQEGHGVDTRFYLAQEFIEGKSLEAHMHERQYSENEARQIAIQVLEILVYLQSLSPMVFHRDIKPANLMIRQDGSVALVDFGAARSLGPTMSATLVGTFGYMPVEQLGGIVDATSDLYALGASLIHVLTRREPWHLLHEPSLVDRMNVSTDLRAFLARLVNPRKEERFQCATDALRALRQDKSAQRRRRWNWNRLFPTPIKLSALPALAAVGGLTGIAVWSFMPNEVVSTARDSTVPIAAETSDETEPASLSLDSAPGKALVRINNLVVGQTPIQLHALRPGVHNIALQKEGYQPVASTLLLDPGEFKELSFELTEKLSKGSNASPAPYVRLSGVTQIQPAANVRVQSATAHLTVCVAKDGHVEFVGVDQSTGFAQYDDKLKSVILATWKYKPREEPGCTSVTFKYNL